MDRKSREPPLYLKPDLELKKAAYLQLAESPGRTQGSNDKPVKILNAEPVVERHKRPFVIHPELHKKTYFNAVEKLLITPQKPPENERLLDPSTWGSQRVLEYNLKKPPSTLMTHPNTSRANTIAAEGDWYDKFINSENIVYEKPQKLSKDFVRLQDESVNKKISPQAVLK